MLHRNVGLATESFVADDWSWPEINKATPPGMKMWQSSEDVLAFLDSKASTTLWLACQFG
jgi:hypothetical protein